VNELVLEVLDLERAEHFYSELLGFTVVERWEHRDAVWVLAGRTRIGLWRPQVGVAGGRGGVHVHYALQIEEQDYAAIVERLRGRGLESPRTISGILGPFTSRIPTGTWSSSGPEMWEGCTLRRRDSPNRGRGPRARGRVRSARERPLYRSA
jgi:Glyoxalase/Bleomycin resistance protein/Dioxygenase superfamily